MPSRRFASSTHTPDYDEKSYYGGNIPLDPAHDVFSWAITFMEIVAGCDLNTFVKPNKDKYTETELNTLIDYELQRRELGMFIPTIKNMVTKDRKKRWSLKKALNKIWNELKRSPKLTDSNVSPLDLKKKFALPSSTP